MLTSVSKHDNTMKKEKTETLGLRIPVSLKAQLQARADENKQSLSELAIVALTAYIGIDNNLITSVNNNEQLDINALRDEIEHDVKAIIADRLEQQNLNTTAILDKIYDRLDKLENVGFSNSHESSQSEILVKSGSPVLLDTLEYLNYLKSKGYTISKSTIYGYAAGKPPAKNYGFVNEHATLTRNENNKAIWRLK